jgi:hypothetical protein
MTEDHLQDAELRRLAERLGQRAADRLDVERTAGAVLQRLRNEVPHKRAVRHWWSQPSWLRMAAAVVLMAGAGVVLRLQTGSRHAPHYVADELRELSTDQLREILGTLDQTLAEPTTIEPSEDDFNGLTTEQLERLLQSLEG